MEARGEPSAIALTEPIRARDVMNDFDDGLEDRMET